MSEVDNDLVLQSIPVGDGQPTRCVYLSSTVVIVIVIGYIFISMTWV